MRLLVWGPVGVFPKTRIPFPQVVVKKVSVCSLAVCAGCKKTPQSPPLCCRLSQPTNNNTYTNTSHLAHIIQLPMIPSSHLAHVKLGSRRRRRRWQRSRWNQATSHHAASGALDINRERNGRAQSSKRHVLNPTRKTNDDRVLAVGGQASPLA